MESNNGYKSSTMYLWMLLFFAMTPISGVSDVSAEGVALSPQLKRITSYKFGDNREDLTKVEDSVRDSFGKPAERLQLENQFVTILQSDATYLGKDFVCRQLRIMGTDVSVPALAVMLTDDELSDMARWALEMNQSPSAGKALRDALGKAEGNALIGVINSLGERKDRESVGAIIGLLSSPNEDVVCAAVTALGKTGGREGGMAIIETLNNANPRIYNAAAWALYNAADTDLKIGMTEVATRLFTTLSTLDTPVRVRENALRVLKEME